MDNNSNTQTQLNALRTLQQSYDALATASSNGATSVEVENAKQAILDAIGAINIDTSDLAKQGSNSAVTLTEVSEKIQQIIDSHVINNTAIDGYTFESSFQPHGIGDIYANYKRVQFINDDKITAVKVGSFFADNTVLQEISFPLLRTLANFAFQNCSALTEVNMPLLEALNHGSFYGCSSLVGISLPSCETTWTDAFSNCAILKEVYLPKLGKNTYVGFASCPNLILIEIGRTAASFSTITLENWSPTNALDSSSSSLVDSGEPFANNLEKLLYNIREHIAANLPDRTGLSSLTIKFSSTVKSAIQADQATADAFANKNWVIA